MTQVNRFAKYLLDLSKLTHLLVRIGRALLTLPICFCINGCVREEVLDDIQSDYFQPQLVVHALLSPGDSILVNVGQSVPLGDSVQTSKITDATVLLSNEQGDTVHLPLVQSDFHKTIYGVSQHELPIRPGATYVLRVIQPQLSEVKAQCTLPTVATPLDRVEYMGKESIPDDDRQMHNVRVSWYDSGPFLHRVYFVDNYQGVNPENNEVIEEGEYYYGHDPFHGIVQTGYFFTYDYNFASNGVFYPDLYVSGDTEYTGEPVDVSLVHHLTTYLITPDEHMARYQASQDIFARNRDALGSESFIELYRGIIPEYTNVEGGLGVFGAYLRSEPVYLTLE